MDERQIIMVDLDDNIVAFKAMYCNKVREIYGVEIDPDDHDNWDCLWKAMAQIDVANDEAEGTAFNVALAACYAEQQILANDALPGAASALSILAKTWDIWYVTDRPHVAHGPTGRWLTARGFPAAHNLVCTTDKRSWLNEHAARIHTVIDDRVRTLLHALIHVRCDHVHGIINRLNSDLTDSDQIHLAQDWEQISSNIHRLHEQSTVQAS